MSSQEIKNQSHPCSRKCHVLYNLTEYVAIEDLINYILFWKIYLSGDYQEVGSDLFFSSSQELVPAPAGINPLLLGTGFAVWLEAFGLLSITEKVLYSLWNPIF